MSEICKFIDTHEIIQTKRPAFCIKTRLLNDQNVKFFINICHSTSVSPPTICINEQELKDMIENEKLDELSHYTIPMILESIQSCKDNKNQIAKVTHAIINRQFYEEHIKNSQVYQSFVIFITNEIVMTKFNVTLDQSSVVILKNKHYQLPDGQALFQERILPYKPAETKLVETLNEQMNSGEKYKNCNDENVRIKLDIEEEIVDIYVKMPSIELSKKNLQVLVNDDHVQIVINNDVFKSFYLSITLVSNLAECFLKKSILSIRCPVIL